MWLVSVLDLDKLEEDFGHCGALYDDDIYSAHLDDERINVVTNTFVSYMSKAIRNTLED